MLTIDEVQNILEEISAEVPEEFYRELNGGISLVPEAKHHPEARAGELFILGQYCHDQMGRYIVIYYGSICASFAGVSVDALRAKLKELIFHEFTHHIESMAGERTLEIKDKIQIEKYKNK